ncbi:MAG TPA: N-6 DNA methylase [Armatimonadota bacterium]|jgi:hypothetical protein
MITDRSHWLTESERRRAGAYYTPSELVDELVESALAPVIEDALRNAAAPVRALLSIRVVDPACGAGAFLVAALEALAERLSAVGGVTVHDARREVLRRCIAGVDNDASAVELCRERLARIAGVPAEDVTGVQLGDSLLAPPPVLLAGPFDCVLGNPPFLNAIERAGRVERRAALSGIAPELGGTADESFHFLALAMRITRPGGRIGMVLPRTVLNAPAAEALRDPVQTARHPRRIRVLSRSDHFPGRQVYVCLLTLGPPGPCEVSAEGRSATSTMEGANWWRGLRGLLDGAPILDGHGPVIGELFQVTAGMTAADAYHVKPYIVDSRAGNGLKLVTTGLIDPDECLWGARTCRYLGEDYRHPRVREDSRLTPALQRRLCNARRPSVIVAGLSSRIECFLDARGEYIGAVSTFAINHPDDDLVALRAVADALSSPEASRVYEMELGANALGGGSIRMTSAFLRAFRM